MRLVVIVAALAFSTAVAEAQYYSRSKIAASGKQIKLNFFNSTNPDCSSSGDPTVRIAQEPQHGRILVSAGRDFPSFSQNNVRSACNTRRVAGRAVNYVSERGYVGSDSALVEVFFTSGHAYRMYYTIQVR